MPTSDTQALKIALREARYHANSHDRVLRAEARIVWARATSGAPCPDQHVPDEPTLALWHMTLDEQAAQDINTQTTALLRALDQKIAKASIVTQTRHIVVHLKSQTKRKAETLRPLEVHRKWLSEQIHYTPQGPGPHPLAPLINAWQHRVRPVQAELRPDRIFPSRLALVRATDRRSSTLFSARPLEHEQRNQLPLKGMEPERSFAALPLALYEAGGGPTNTSQSAALPFRLWIESILALPYGQRQPGQPVLIEISLSELIKRLYPGMPGQTSRRKPRTTEWRPRLEAAVEVLDTMWLDYPGRRRRVVIVSQIPETVEHDVRIVVDLPDGAKDGPVLPHDLGRWGLKSAVAYRGLINLSFAWYEPGRTSHPVRRISGKGHQWIWRTKPELFPRLTDTMLMEVFFPTSTRQQRRNLIRIAHQWLDTLEKAGQLRVVPNQRGTQHHILPPGVTPGAPTRGDQDDADLLIDPPTSPQERDGR